MAYLNGIALAETASLRVPAQFAQSQSSLAVTADGASWAMLNASPDIRQQIADAPPLHPTGLRELPLRSVLVTNGDIDHVAGLLTLREMQPFTLFTTAGIHDCTGAKTDV